MSLLPLKDAALATVTRGLLSMMPGTTCGNFIAIGIAFNYDYGRQLCQMKLFSLHVDNLHTPDNNKVNLGVMPSLELSTQFPTRYENGKMPAMSI